MVKIFIFIFFKYMVGLVFILNIDKGTAQAPRLKPNQI